MSLQKERWLRVGVPHLGEDDGGEVSMPSGGVDFCKHGASKGPG